MEKQLRLFIAAAFMAALTGCPTTPNPPVDSDTGTPPGDSGMPDLDSGTDPVDAGVDANIPPGDGGGTDTGTLPSVCEDPEFVGLMCNLPTGMAYNRDGFICASFINNDQWITDVVGSVPEREYTREEGGVLYAFLAFARANTGLYMPTSTIMEFTCGNEGRCWLNWANPVSNYSHCRVSFLPDCSVATTECWAPDLTDPVVSQAYYVGE
ncbi:hypothetical protein K8R04_05140 [Candidatus Uhrbacteria bacterium]|nr:hypothetical protein [Candidatus Uhrbacteria bacterium]